jgi:hypothetical protein
MFEPTPENIRAARTAAGLTQTDASALVYCKLRAWIHWEAGSRAMPEGLFELFLIKTDPTYKVQRLRRRRTP